VKPILLEVEGLYSYRERTSIDFEKLTRAGLFGIFGPVGSGKSAILEAVTFALYGETARMTRNERSYNMMNLRSDKLFIDFRFRVRGVVYRFTASSSRNSKDFNDIRNPKRGAYKEESGEWVPLDGGVSENAERILGLNYMNFRRTIIIPQGKFQEFLQLKNTDRTIMLEELFKLEKFNLQQKTSRLSRETQIDISGINGQLEQMDDITDERIAELNRFLAELDIKQAARKSRIDLLDVKEKELSLKAGLALELAELMVQFNESVKSREEADRREEAANRLEEIRNIFAVPVRSLSDGGKKLIQREAELSEAIGEESALAERRKRKDGDFLSFSNEYALKDERNGKLENLERLVKLKVKDEELSVWKARKAKLDLEAEALSLRGASLTEALNDIKEKIEGDRKSLPPSADRIALQRWLDDQVRFNGELEKSREEVKNLKDEARELEAKNFSRIEHSPFAGEFPGFPSNGISSIDGLKETLNTLEKKTRTQRDELREIQNHLVLKARFADLSAELVDGTACPLCGSLDHPGVSVADEPEAAVTEIPTDNPDEAWEAFGELKRDLLIFTDLWKSLENRTSSRNEELAALEREAASHSSLFKWEKFASGLPEEDQKIIEGFHALEEIIRNDEGSFSGIEDNLKDVAVKGESLKASVARESEAAAGLSALADALREDIPLDFADLRKEIPAQELLEESEKIRQKLKLLEEDRIRLEAEETLLGKEEAALAQKLETGRNLTFEVEAELKALEEELRGLLDKSDFGSREEVEEILKSEVSLQDERREIQLIRQEVSRLEGRISDLKNELGDFVYKEEEHEGLKSELLLLKTEWEEGVGKAGELKKSIQDITEKLKDKSHLLEKRKTLLSREENLKTLFSMFKARGFVNYVSTLYLRELVEGANSRFETLCSRSMKLELRDDNSFAVRDFLNGGKLRSVKTLSGGQTFLASLSLALALADSVNAGNSQTGEEGFFFLDEGFGSLDKESLRIVMEALWSLGKEKRVVGVISHVEEMKEEIPSFILVGRDEETGSSITPGWTI